MGRRSEGMSICAYQTIVGRDSKRTHARERERERERDGERETEKGKRYAILYVCLQIIDE
jgi:hypothetical protein